MHKGLSVFLRRVKEGRAKGIYYLTPLSLIWNWITYDRKVGVIPFPHELVSTAGYKLEITVHTKVDFQKTPLCYSALPTALGID